jgi:hypothetical protein
VPGGQCFLFVVFGVSDDLCLSFSALHFFQLFFSGPPPLRDAHMYACSCCARVGRLDIIATK